MKRVYLDHNSTTPVRAEVRARLLETIDALGGNPSSVHASGRRARALLDEARVEVAEALAVGQDEVVFTSGGTESNNLALFGALRAAGPGSKLVTTAVEHSAVLDAARRLEEDGQRVVRVGVDSAGRPDLERLAREGRDAALVSVIAANNEIGTLTPLSELRAALQDCRAGALLHTDAVQALGRVPVPLREWGVDLASFSAHKLGGPPGCGLLYRRAGVALAPILCGGGQEAGLRPGTENVPGAVASALAVRLAVRERAVFAHRTWALARTLWREVRTALPDACLHGPAIGASDRLPNTINFSLPGVDGRVLVTRLDLEGLEVSAGSACASGSLEPSHVLLAMGLDVDRARAGLRLSLGRTTTEEDVHTAVDMLSRTLARRA